jgi:hypothetical protein
MLQIIWLSLSLWAYLAAWSAQPAMQAPRPFWDVPTTHWAYQAVADLKQQGILLGYPTDYDASSPETAWSSFLKAMLRNDKQTLRILTTPEGQAAIRKILQADRGIIKYARWRASQKVIWEQRTTSRAVAHLEPGYRGLFVTLVKTEEGWKISNWQTED